MVESSDSSSSNVTGLLLAVLSSGFIGASFVLEKKGLKRAATMRSPGGRGGYAYLVEPLWWAGMSAMFIGEVLNFVAYVFAPAVLVTPLGALSIIISSVLAHFFLHERLQKMSVLGCILCIVGSVVIVIHAPEEQTPSSIEEIWELATEPAFLIYTAAAVCISLALILYFDSRYGETNILVYLGVCSFTGSLTVLSTKAIGIAVKLTVEGDNQLAYFQTYVFLAVALVCLVTQLNYLNKALDTFETSIVSPVYFVMFTTCTLLASGIMFKDWSGQDATSISSEVCGFVTIISGTILLHSVKDQQTPPIAASISWYVHRSHGESMKQLKNDHFVSLLANDLLS